MIARHSFTALLIALALAPSASAQDAATRPGCVSAIGPDTSASVGPRAPLDTTSTARSATNPDLRIFASVSADEVLFAKAPQICVRLTGDARLDTLRIVGRRNLSSPVVAGTSYRNVYVAVELLGHLNATCIASRITRTPPADSMQACAALEVKTGAPPP